MTRDRSLPASRPAHLPPDGAIVTAMTAVGPDSDRTSERVVGPLETWWVGGLDFWQVVVAGWAVEPESVTMVDEK